MDWRGAAKGESAIAAPAIPLRARLAEIRANTRALVSPEHSAPIERAVAELQRSGIAQSALATGMHAPTFELPDQNGKIVHSVDLLASGPLIVIFYRGRWCPYCVATLEMWQQLLPRVEAAGARLVAISPQKPQHTFFTADQHQLRFPVLSDAGNQVARQFGLVYRLPDYLEHHYRRVFINLPNSNADQSWELPIPATYVISRDGFIRFALADADFTQRAEPEDVLAELNGNS
jgi:peroxiredoxin